MERPEASPQVFIPPPDAILLRKHERIDTPVDSRGLVDVPGLIVAVKEQVDPAYIWQGVPDVHHFYWPSAYYPRTGKVNMPGTYHRFRNLAVHKGLLPRDFHNLIHKITVPPPVPDPEIISDRTDAWATAENLFVQTLRYKHRLGKKAARKRMRYMAMNPELKEEFAEHSVIDQEAMQSTLEEFFTENESKVKKLVAMFRQLELVEKPEDPMQLVSGVSSIIAKRHLELVPVVMHEESRAA